MPMNSESKKLTAQGAQSQTKAELDPEGFLTELDIWGTKPNPASFEKLLESNYEKFARALKQGYSAEDVCRLAASYGIQVKASTFRKYWQKLNGKSPFQSSSDTSSKQSTIEPLTSLDSPASTTGNAAVNF